MYIRRTKTKTLEDGSAYYTYRIVESVRLRNQVKQLTLLNIGADFTIEQEHWPLLTARIEQLQQGSAPHQTELFDLADDLNQLLELAAQRYCALITAKLFEPLNSKKTTRHNFITLVDNYLEKRRYGNQRNPTLLSLGPKIKKRTRHS